MSGRRVRALFRRVVQEIRRDRPSLALLFIAPILVTGLVTFILREGQTPTVDAVIVNGAGAPGVAAAGVIKAALEADGGTATIVPDAATAEEQVRDGSATLAITLPAGLGTGGATTITVLTNGLDPSGEATQVAALQRALIGAASAITGASPPTIEHTTLYGTPSGDPLSPFAPAIVGFFAYFFVYILTGVSFLRERTGGTLERLMATPVTRGEIVTGYILGFGLFATIQVALLMTWALSSLHVPAIGPLPDFWVGLGIPIAGSPIYAFLVVVLTALGAVSLGIFLSTFARTELQIIQFIPLVLVPQFLLSGVLFPVSSLPAIVQPIARIMPLTYTVEGLRQVFIAGADLASAALRFDLLVLAGFAVFFATIASLTIRRDVV
jgi:ABC-2 type transport system permease protein